MGSSSKSSQKEESQEDSNELGQDLSDLNMVKLGKYVDEFGRNLQFLDDES